MSTFTSSNWAQNVLQDPGHAASRTGLPDMILPSECSPVSGRSTDTATDARPHGSPIAVLLRLPRPCPACNDTFSACHPAERTPSAHRSYPNRSLARVARRPNRTQTEFGEGRPRKKSAASASAHPPPVQPRRDQSYTANRTRSRWYLPDRTLVCRCGLTVHDAWVYRPTQQKHQHQQRQQKQKTHGRTFRTTSAAGEGQGRRDGRCTYRRRASTRARTRRCSPGPGSRAPTSRRGRTSRGGPCT